MWVMPRWWANQAEPWYQFRWTKVSSCCSWYYCCCWSWWRFSRSKTTLIANDETSNNPLLSWLAEWNPRSWNNKWQVKKFLGVVLVGLSVVLIGSCCSGSWIYGMTTSPGVWFDPYRVDHKWTTPAIMYDDFKRVRFVKLDGEMYTNICLPFTQ